MRASCWKTTKSALTVHQQQDNMFYLGSEAYLGVTICGDNFKTGFEAPGQIDYQILTTKVLKSKAVSLPKTLYLTT